VQEEVGHAVIERDPVEGACGVLVEEPFGVVRAALVARVVCVLAFLAVADEETVAGRARDHAGVREGVLARAGAASASEDILDFCEACSGDERLVRALVGLATPPERAGVDGVGEEDRDVAAGDVLAASAAQSDASCKLDEVVQAVRARCCGIEEFDDERCFFGVGFDAFGASVVPVAKRSPGRPPAFGCFLVHTFFHFFAEVLDVVLGHEHAHPGEEAHAGVCTGVEDGALLDEVDRETQTFERAVVLEVPREPIDLFDDESGYLRVLAEEREHGAEP
jgi:hypothetical protein